MTDNALSSEARELKNLSVSKTALTARVSNGLTLVHEKQATLISMRVTWSSTSQSPLNGSATAKSYLLV